MPGVYISWPFCSQKCTYCNFASGVFPRSLESQYLEKLLAEIRSTDWPWTPETVYLGGGTPGSLAAETLALILGCIPGRPWQEATIEVAPGAVTLDQARSWASLGITRVSLGVQSFVDAEIRRTGRKHNAFSVAADVATLRAAGITEFNIDLIAGLPAQTAEGWHVSLDWIESLKAPHASIYMLEVDEDSRLGRELLAGGTRYGAHEVPTEDQIADFYESAAARLASIGIPRYEISNFARPGHESLHNLKYWKLAPYLGFGSDAHSFDGLIRWQNVESPRDYAARPNPRLDSTPANLAEERFFVGLRLAEGIGPTPQEWILHKPAIDRLVAEGLLESTESRLRLTPRGILFSNEVFQAFL